MRVVVIVLAVLLGWTGAAWADAASELKAGETAAARGDYNAAIQHFTQAIKLAPGANAYFGRGLAYENEGLYDKAIADYTKVIQLKAGNADAYNNRANAYAYKGAYTKALADYAKALQLKPGFAASYNGRAWTYHLMGNDAKALADANKSISLVASDANAYETRGEIYEKLGQREKAIADYRKSVALDPKQKLSRDALKRLGVVP